MAELSSSVQYLKGIGEKKAQAFEKLGVFSLYDLVSYFPSRYEDRTKFCPIAKGKLKFFFSFPRRSNFSKGNVTKKREQNKTNSFVFYAEMKYLR